MSTNYKDTLLMPKTEFEMKANLATKEVAYIERWFKDDIYRTQQNDLTRKKSFVLHDGPPYANGNLHTGHAVNKVLKDIIVRDKALNNMRVSWKIGWDTHGLPIETAIKKANPDFAKDLENDIDYINACFEYAKGQVLSQNKQFQRMALFTDFDDYYATYQKDFEARQIGVLAKMFEKGLIYRDLKPVFWSPTSRSALAEAEVEYKNKDSHSVYVAFGLIDTKNTFLVIWTTTPWTLIGNVAIAINDRVEYSFVKNGEKTYIVAADLLENFKTVSGFELNTVKTVKGTELVNLKYTNPLEAGSSWPVLAGSHVDLEAGTGLVHTAGAHGIEDFHLAKQNKLPIISVMNDEGMICIKGKFENTFYEKASLAIIEELKTTGSLINHSIINHSYPHDWRTKKPIVYRATKQWFVSIDKVKTKILGAIKKVKWFPSWGEDRISSMIANRDDWTISRQRKWGVPIAVIYDENDNVVNTPATWERIVKLFAAKGQLSWRQTSIKEILGDDFKEGINYRKELDIMDVWFDSGTSWTMLESKVADLYLEGTDQHRGWFNSSLITSTIVQNKAPYKNVLTHGFVNDENGNKMSKSLGNVIDPIAIANKTGFEIIRLWIGLSNYKSELSIGENVLTQVGETYRKIRNTLRFMLGNLYDFESKDIVKFAKLEPIDKGIVTEFNELLASVAKHNMVFDFWSSLNETMMFMVERLSNFYFDFAKDILYVEKANSVRRRQIQTVINYTFERLLYVLAPVLPVTVEEAYDNYNLRQDVKSIWLTSRVKNNLKGLAPKLDPVFELRKKVNLELEKARTNKLIGKSLEAQITFASKDLSELIELDKMFNLKQILMVSKVVFESSNDQELVIKVSASDGLKCNRCWVIYDSLANEEICTRCLDAIK